MSTSRDPSVPSSSGAAVVKLATAFAMIWIAARVLLACDATSDGACLRFSDCASGLTCANGECVTPPAADTDGSAASGSSSGSTTGTSGAQSTSGDTSGDTTGTGDESDDSGTTSTE